MNNLHSNNVPCHCDCCGAIIEIDIKNRKTVLV